MMLGIIAITLAFDAAKYDKTEWDWFILCWFFLLLFMTVGFVFCHRRA